MPNTKGNIYNIQRFSIYDGPGTRTVIFFKGCNLRCRWCHNPESISAKKQVEMYLENCIGCGTCFEICPNKAHYIDEDGVHRIDRERCDGCFMCVENCFAEALVGVGKSVSVGEVMESILTDVEYYKNSGGGVTFSGGECMLQIDFLKAVMAECKRHNIHTAADIAGNVPWSFFEKIIDETDLFLYDLKAIDSKLHVELTGRDNALILENLTRLSDLSENIYVRIPLIVDLNDHQIDGIGDTLKDLNIKRVEVMPYHKLGASKYVALDMEDKTKDLELTSDEEVEKAVEILRKKGLPAFAS